MARMNYSTRGGNVGSMKKAAKADFVPGLARRARAGEKPEVTLRPGGITETQFEREARRNGLGYTKYKGGKYKLVFIGS